MTSDNSRNSRKKPARIVPVFFYSYICVPLLYIPSLPNLTRELRLLALMGILSVALLLPRTRTEFGRNFTELPKNVKLLLLGILLAILTSTLTSHSRDTAFIGVPPEYLGLLSWLLFLGIGLLFRQDAIKLLLTRTTLYIFTAALVVSLLTNIFYIIHGFRISGIMFQSTTMAMYALVCAVLCLHQLSIDGRRRQITNYLILLLSIATVMLCQSRIGYVMLTLILSLLALRHFKARRGFALILTGLVVIITVLPQLQTDYFMRFQSDRVHRGITYRAHLYKASVPDLLKHNLIIGNGPATLPSAINNPSAVPEDVAASLKLGYTFLSTHDMYFDFAYFFGSGAVFALLILTYLTIKNFIGKYDIRNLTLLLLIIVMIGNALFNIPSLELTSMYFVIMFALLESERQKRAPIT